MARTQAVKLDERNNLVLQHMPLVKAIAAQIRQKLPDHVEMDDLIQAGTMGLLDAVNRYVSEKAVSFGAYAKHRVRGAILDSLRQVDWASRETRRQQRCVEQVVRDLSMALQRTPTEAEIADTMGMGLEQWRRMMINIRIELVPATTLFRDDDDQTPRDFPDKAENQPESLCARNQLHETLRKAVKTLSEREQAMLALYYDDEISMSEISRKFGVHESRTSQIHKAAVQKLSKVFASAGILSSQAC